MQSKSSIAGNPEALQLLSPTRLQIARQRRAMTMRDLAEGIGVTTPTISKYESAVSNPEPEIVHKMAFVLQFPLGWFYAPDLKLIESERPSFRARRSMSAELRNKATRAGDIAASVVSPYFRSKFKLPTCDVPDLSGHEPEEAAIYLRRQWKLGNDPISNMVHLLESKGVEIYWLTEESTSLSAWSVWNEEYAYILLNNNNTAGDRARFDAAHELGHLALHRHEQAIDKYQLEKQADAFASAFLLPREAYRQDSPKYPVLNQFFPLKKKWGVSIQAMIVRSTTLGIFLPWQYHQAFKELSGKGWRTAEPIPIKREESLLQKMMLERLAEKELLPREIAKEIFLRPSDFYELVPMSLPVEKQAQTPTEPARGQVMQFKRYI